MDLHTSLVSFNITSFFFFNDTATTEIYTLSLHDALPILLLDDVTLKNTTGATKSVSWFEYWDVNPYNQEIASPGTRGVGDRKSTRLNSSHLVISYAVFCLKKNNTPSPPTCSQRVRV